MKIEINKGSELIDAEEIFKKKVTKFSNSAHIIVPIKMLNKQAIIIIEKEKLTNVKVSPVKKNKDGTWKIGLM